MSNTVTIKNEKDEEQIVSLADIAGVDMTAIQEYEGGFDPQPKGVYTFEVKDCALKTVETRKGDRGVIALETEITAVHAITDPDVNPEDQVGKKYVETIFISDLAKGLGNLKAIMSNGGFVGSGKLAEMMDAFCGHSFVSPIKHRKDKDDADKIYDNFDVKKITPVSPPLAANAQPAVAGGIQLPGT